MRLGELLVDADAISREELARALADQRRAGGQLGEHLVRRQAIGEPMLHYYLGVQRTLRRRELERFSRLGPLLRLSAEYCRQSPRAIAAALALLFLGTALTLTFPYLVKLVLDYQIHAGSAGRIAAVCAGAALLLAAGQLATYLGSRLVVALDVRFAAHLRRRLYAVLLRLHVTSLVRRSTGDWLTRLTTDVDNVVDRWEQLFLTFWKNLFAIALSCAIVGTVDPLLTLVVLALSIAMVLLPGRVSNLANPWLMRRRPLSAALVALAQEKLRGFKTLATFDARREALGEFGRRFDEYYRNDFRMVRPWNMAFNLRTVMGALLSGVILFAGGHAVLAGRYGVGDLMMLILTVGLLAPYVDEMMLIIIKTNDVKRYWLECCATLDMNVDPERFTGDAPDLVRVAGDVALDRLSFQYGERPVLRDLSLRLAARRSYALVGRSGAGKSTLLRLLLRELEPSRGRVLLGGRPLGDLSDRAVAANIAYIAQKPVLFQASAADNIRLGGLGLFGDVTAAQVEEAARRAGIHERILALPRGYDTMLGDGAEVLSGGERQRVAIARALLKAPALCLFDEPTAALDPDSERWVLETILSLTSHSTVVISTHNLALIRRVDEVLLLDGDQTRLVPPGAIDLGQLVALLERAPEGEPATAA